LKTIHPKNLILKITCSLEELQAFLKGDNSKLNNEIPNLQNSISNVSKFFKGDLVLCIGGSMKNLKAIV
jgi:hypothetical protein